MGPLWDPLPDLLGFDRTAYALHLRLGDWHLDLEGRATFLLLVSITVLVLAAIPVFLSRQSELRRRWTTWALILPVIGIPIWIGPGPTALLAALITIQAVREYAHLTGISPGERAWLFVLAVAYPLAAWLRPDLLTLAPLAALACAVPALIGGDATAGFRRATLTSFGSIWICWAMAFLVGVWPETYVVCFAVAAVDIAAWCGGKGLRRFGWARRPLSPLSPNKTVGGTVGAAVGGVVVLLVLGSFTPGLWIAVVIGGVGGDLLESMVKRWAGVKDAGSWLPGFGGLLDRVDSLLLVLPLAAVLS